MSLYKYVITRHLQGHRPVPHCILEFNYELSESDMSQLLRETKMNFVEKFCEFKEASWWIDPIIS